MRSATRSSAPSPWSTSRKNSWVRRSMKSVTVVMSRTSQDYRRRMRAEDSNLVIGLVHSGKARAWRFASLRRHPVVNDRHGQLSVLVLYDASNGTAVLYGRRVDRRELSFVGKDGALRDHQTGSQWDRITGRAVSGPLKGRRLPRLSGTISYAHAWATFYAESAYWEAPKPRTER